MAGSGRGPRVAHTPASGRIRALRHSAATRYLRLFAQVKAGSGRVAAPLPGSVPLPAAAGAAGHQFLGGWPYPLGIAAILVLIYALSCWWFPFARCWCCSGAGRHSRKDGKVWRRCRWCRQTGTRLRHGRRLYNAIQRRRKAAQ